MSLEEQSVKDGLLQVAHDICEAEPGVSSYGVSERLLTWRADQAIFSRLIGLKSVKLDRSIGSGNFRVVEAELAVIDEDMSIQVETGSDGTLDDDIFAIDILELFRKTYYGHPHQELCLAKFIQKQKPNPEISFQQATKSVISTTETWSSGL